MVPVAGLTIYGWVFLRAYPRVAPWLKRKIGHLLAGVLIWSVSLMVEHHLVTVGSAGSTPVQTAYMAH